MPNTLTRYLGRWTTLCPSAWEGMTCGGTCSWRI